MLGIDLGHSFATFTFFAEEEPLPIGAELSTVPLCVSFPSDVSATDVIVGSDALLLVDTNPANTIIGVTSLLGKKYDELSAEFLQSSPVPIVDRDNVPHYEVLYRGQTKRYSAPAFVLTRIKVLVAQALGEPPRSCLIVVGAHWTDLPRSAVKDAAAIAGLDVMRIITEVTGILVAHKQDKTINHNGFLCDVGATTCKLTIYQLDDGIIERLDHSVVEFGGSHIDSILAEFFVVKVAENYAVDISNRKTCIGLKLACERAKELALVNIEWVNNDGMTLIKILIDSRGTKYTVELSGEIFRCLTEDYLNEFVSIVQTFLSNSPVKIERTTFAGGSFNMRRLRELLRSTVDEGVLIIESADPSHLSSLGGACLLRELSRPAPVQLLCMPYFNLSPSVGIESCWGQFSNILAKDVFLPSRQQKLFYPYFRGQYSALISLYQGERNYVADNHFYDAILFIDDLSLDSILEVTFDVDADAGINVVVRERIAKSPPLKRNDCERKTHHDAIWRYMRSHESDWTKYLLLFSLFSESIHRPESTRTRDFHGPCFPLGSLPRELVLAVCSQFLNLTFLPLCWMEPIEQDDVASIDFDTESLRSLEVARTKVRSKYVRSEDKARLSQAEIDDLIAQANRHQDEVDSTDYPVDNTNFPRQTFIEEVD